MRPIACDPDMTKDEHLYWESLVEDKDRDCLNCGMCEDCIERSIAANDP